MHLLAPADERDVVDAGNRGGVRPSWTGRVPVVAAVVAALVAAGVHVLAAWRPHGPVWTDDEIGILANARVIAGLGPLDLAHMSYYPGWSIVLAPLWWLSDDPGTVYRLAVLASGACGIALLVPLARLARYVGLSTPMAVIAAAVVVAAPGRTVMSSYALTESFLTLVVAWTAVAAVRYATRRTVGAAVGLGLLSGAAFVVHGRAIGVLGMAVVWFGAELLRRRSPQALAGLAAALATAGSGFALHLWVSGQLYGSAGGGRESDALSTLLLLEPVSGALSALGQAWYVATAWLALPFLGVWVVLRLCRREGLRGADLGWWALGVLVAGLVVSVPPAAEAIGRGSGRIDVVAYGRYLEPFTTVLALVGVAYLVRGAARRAVLAVAATTVVVCGAFLFGVVPTVARGGWWAPINIAGLMGRPWPPQGDLGPAPWTAFTLTAVVAAITYVLLRRRPWLLLVPLLGYLALSSVLAQSRTIGPMNEAIGVAPDLVPVVEALDPERIAYDRFGADWMSQNSMQFWLAGRDVEVFNSAVDRPPADLVIARSDWVAGEAQGAVRLVGSRRDEALWVMPGPLAQRLRADGVLEGVAPGAPLPDYGFDVELASGGHTLELGDDPLELDLEVTNLGETLWPALGTTGSPLGIVRVLVRWPTADGVEQQLVELPYSVVPGAHAEVEALLDVPDDVVTTAPLEVTLVHEGVGMFDDHAGRPLTVDLVGSP